MTPDERARLTLYAWMQDTADEEKAEALMASLPPTHWPDLATRQDLESLEHKLEHEIAAVEQRLTAALHRELRSQMKAYIAWSGGLTITLAAFFASVTAVAVR